MNTNEYDENEALDQIPDRQSAISNSEIDSDEEEIEPFDFNNLPEYACNYCGIQNKEDVIKCTFKNCNKWFCNGRGKDRLGSHIIIHLVKSKHKEISLHPEGPHGDTALECFLCGNKNIFLLGFVPIQSPEDSQVIIICRMPCLNSKSYNNLDWDVNDWTPIIEEKMLVNWLVKPPSDLDFKRSRKLTLEQINALEEMRKTNPDAKIEDLDKPELKNNLKEVLLCYENGKQYYNIFLPLIEMEAQYDKKLKESQTQSGITVRWDMSLKKKRLAYFLFSSKEDFESNLLPGNELKISLKSHNWSSKGHVIKITANEEVCLELNSSEPPPTSITSDYTVEFVWKSTSFTRMKMGLKKFYTDEKSISSYLYFRLLGQKVPEPVLDFECPQNFAVPNLPELNIYQLEAIKKALRSPLCLIQGPPGTGKTITSACIVYHLSKIIQKRKSQGQILVCAPSNIVVDQLAEKIHNTGLKVVRICSKSREAVSSNVEFLTLHSQVRSLDCEEYKDLSNFFQLYEDVGELNPKDEKEFARLKEKAEIEILSSADVICSTCITAADPRLRDFKFQHILIDEATQAIESECLLPMLKGAKQVILVGDHRQLGPVITCRSTAKAGLNKSMFERLVSMGIRPIRLQVQYRMHPELTLFPSNTFYEGTLQNGVTASDRVYEGEFPWPNKEKPMFFFNLYGVEEISASGTSYLNRVEATQIEKIVYAFIKSGIKPQKLGIITPYKGQRAFIVNHLLKNGQLSPNIYKEIEVASVDGFQGREKDFIIISCVRSNDGMGIGFLTDPRRLNVTLTRARYGLIICGNAKVLSRDNLWNNLLNHYKENAVLVEGSLNSLKQSSLKFKLPQKYIPERRNFNQDLDDNKSNYSSYMKNDNLNNFDNFSMASLPGGSRASEFGFNNVPNFQPFQRTSCDIGLNKIENYGKFLMDHRFESIIPEKIDDPRQINQIDENKDTENQYEEEEEDTLENMGRFLPQGLLGPDELDLNIFTKTN